jgi:hypothetical protein
MFYALRFKLYFAVNLGAAPSQWQTRRHQLEGGAHGSLTPYQEKHSRALGQ